MKIFKVSSILLMSLFLMTFFIPEASAKCHHHRKSRTSFSFNLGLGLLTPPPAYGVTYVTQPAPVVVQTPVPAYYEQVTVYQQPYIPARQVTVYQQPYAGFYAAPGFSYYRY